jgi:hypothetical protein
MKTFLLENRAEVHIRQDAERIRQGNALDSRLCFREIHSDKWGAGFDGLGIMVGSRAWPRVTAVPPECVAANPGSARDRPAQRFRFSPDGPALIA